MPFDIPSHAKHASLQELLGRSVSVFGDAEVRADFAHEAAVAVAAGGARELRLSGFSPDTLQAAFPSLDPDIMQRLGEIPPPRFRPEAWNRSATIRESNNCYAYAVDSQVGGWPQPGQAFGVTGGCPDEPAAYTERAALDGLIPTGATLEHRLGHYQAALFIAPGEDYHWARRNVVPVATWSDKVCKGDVRLLRDAAGDAVTDATIADSLLPRDKGAPYRFAGFFLVPNTGLEVGGPKSGNRRLLDLLARTARPAP